MCVYWKEFYSIDASSCNTDHVTSHHDADWLPLTEVGPPIGLLRRADSTINNNPSDIIHTTYY